MGRCLVWLAGAVSFLVVGCDDATPPAALPTSGPSIVEEQPQVEQAKVKAAIAEIRAEPKVKDFAYDPLATVKWQAAVISDGSPQYGYAEYLCQVIREAGAMDGHTIVRVVDAREVAQGRGFHDASLGAVVCEDGTRFDDAPAAKA